MDKVKKLLGMDDPSKNSADNSGQKDGDDIRKKSTWFENEPDEDDGRIFGGFGPIFINPTELQKQIESQLEEIMRQMENVDDGVGQEGIFVAPDANNNLMRDEELKGEDFKRLIKSSEPFISTSPSIARRKGKETLKATDDEKIMDLLHGTKPVEPQTTPMISRKSQVTPYLPPGHPKVEIWSPVGPAGMAGKGMFQSVITTTVRRPDGSTETRKITTDKDGNKTTTVSTITANGERETRTFTGRNGSGVDVPKGRIEQGEEIALSSSMPRNESKIPSLLNLARHLFVNPSGYTMPQNMW